MDNTLEETYRTMDVFAEVLKVIIEKSK
ncbi:hypothetical protein ACFVT8_16600 [Lysinibacillus sp. NPDC058147]